MRFSTLEYFIKDAFKSLKRNTTISFASMATVLATLFVFGAFLLAGININRGVNDAEAKVQVQVYLKNNIKMTEQKEIEIKLRSIDGVKDVNYETKEKALHNFRDQLTGYEEILDGYGEENNPMPDSFSVKLENAGVGEVVEKELKDFEGVEDVANNEEYSSKISSFAKVVKWVGLILFVILVGVSLFLIVNTIRLAVYSRRREVSIMKFVGATDWFIRWPFIIEGIVIGVVGAILADLALFFVYRTVFNWVHENSVVSNLLSPMYVFYTMSWQFVLAGILIGMFGSIIALRKFLKV